MNHLHPGAARAALALGLTLLLGACATRQPATSAQPNTNTSASKADCQALLSEMESSEADKRIASEKKANAWKAVVPFIVAARYASSQSQLGEADERIEKLKAQFERQGCTQLSS